MKVNSFSLRLWHQLTSASAIAAIALCAATGCGKSSPGHVPTYAVSGSITLQGKPMPGAYVVLHPKSDAQQLALAPRASVADDGTFTLTTYNQSDGAPEGEYTLTVQWFRPIKRNGDWVSGPNAVPKKYSSARTSDIQIKVASGENRLPPIQLR